MSYVSLLNETNYNGNITATSISFEGNVDFTNASPITGLADGITLDLITNPLSGLNQNLIEIKDAGVTDIKIVSVNASKLIGAISITGSIIYFTLPLNMGNLNINNINTLSAINITLNSIDLNTRLTTDENAINNNATNITSLLNRTQYQSAGSNITTFTGTLAVPAISLNSIDLQTSLTTLNNKTQCFGTSGQLTSTLNANYQNISFLNNITTTYATIGSSSGFVKLAYGIVGTSAINESDVVNLSTDLTTLNNKTQYLDTTGQYTNAFNPSVNYTYNLGANLKAWNNVYCADVNLSGSLLSNSITTLNNKTQCFGTSGQLISTLNGNSQNISSLNNITTTSATIGSSSGFVKLATGIVGTSAINESDVVNLSTDLTTLNNKTQCFGTSGQLISTINGNSQSINFLNNIKTTSATIGSSSGFVKLAIGIVGTSAINESDVVNLSNDLTILNNKTQNFNTSGQISSTILPSTNNTYNLGNSSSALSSVFANNIYCTDVSLSGSSVSSSITTLNNKTQNFNTSGQISSTILPSTNNTYNLGNSSSALSTVFANNINSNDNLSIAVPLGKTMTLTSHGTQLYIDGQMNFQSSGGISNCLNISGDSVAGLTLSGNTKPITTYNDIIPNAVSTCNVGTNAVPFSEMHASSLYCGKLNNTAGCFIQYNSSTKITVTTSGVTMGGDINSNSNNIYSVSRLAVGSTSTTIALGYFVGGVTNVSSEQTIIRCVSNNNDVAKIEIQSNNASAHLFELRSMTNGDFTICDRTGGRTTFTILGTNGVTSLGGLLLGGSSDFRNNNMNNCVLTNKEYGLISLPSSQNISCISGAWTQSVFATTTGVNFSTNISDSIVGFRFTYTGTRTRFIDLTANVSINYSVVPSTIYMAWFKNGSLGTGQVAICTAASLSSIYNLTVIDQISMALGDYVQIYFKSNNSGTLTVNTGTVRCSGELN